MKCPFKKEHLSLGDFTWYHHSSCSILNSYVIERKSARDLVSSIIDGRFNEQKRRLMKLRDSGKGFNVVLLIEMPSKYSSQFKKATVEQAYINALVLDGFQIVTCRNTIDTARYLHQMTKYLNGLKNPSFDRMPLREYNEKYAKNANLKEAGGISVREAVARFLVQIKGISVERVCKLVQDDRFSSFPRLIQSVKNDELDDDNISELIKKIF